MSFPAIHYGNYGDEKTVQTTKIGGLPLGIRMALPDGRMFVHARAGGTAIVVGKLYEAATAAAASDGGYTATLTVAAATVGATTLSITAGATTAITTDQYEDGTVFLASSTAGGTGYSYKIKSNNSAAAGSAATFTLYPSDGLHEAVAGGTTTAGLRENLYRLVKLTTADTVTTGTYAGVSCATAAASAYVWLARKGEANTFVGGTVISRGEAVVASTGVAGAVADIVTGTAGITSVKAGAMIVGNALSNGTANGFALVDLKLD